MSALSIAAAAWSAAIAAVAACAAFRTRRRDAPQQAGAGSGLAAGSVLLLRPCAGDEPHLARALGSSRAADPRWRLRILVADAGDGAMAEATRVASELRSERRDARVVVTEASAPNMKAAQLARALDLEGDGADVVVVADSDVELSSEALSALLAPLASREAQAAWVPSVEICPSTRADRASAAVLDASLHAFPLLAGLDPGGMVGKLFAVRRDALEAVGGFAALVDHLGEDVELSRRLRRIGLRVRACPAVVGSLASGRTWRDVVQRYARWIAVVRAQRTPLLVSYPLLFGATPLVVVLAAGGIARDGVRGALSLAFALAVRFGIAVLARRRARRDVRPARALIDGLVADGVLLAAFVRALARRDLTWRGLRLELAPRGLLERVR